MFTAAEEEKLQSLFGLNEPTLRLVLSSCCYIFEQAAFSSTGPEPLYDLLLEAGFDESHGKVSFDFVTIYMCSALIFSNLLS